MKRGLFIAFYSLLACVILTSCSLFIDEEDEAIDYGDVPVHTGQGYDAPAKATESGCDIAYQFKSNVRSLSERDLQFITYARHDETGALVEIHYAGNTPKELLPVLGEILVSGVNDKFEWGCCHRMNNSVYESGVYKYLGTICNIKEVYEVLDIDGELSTEDEEEYWVAPEPEEDENDEAAQIRTRASDEEEEKGSLEVKFLSDGFSIKIPIAFSISAELPYISGNITMEAEKNFTKVTLQAKFDDFTLTNPVFKLVKTVEDKNTIAFGGAFTLNKHKTFRPVKGKAFTIGPVVIVFFVNIDVDLTLGVNFTAEFSRHKKVVYTYTVDLYNGTCTKATKKEIDKPWSLSDATASISFEAELSFMFGFGFYGKIFSVRFGPLLNFTAEAGGIPKTFEGFHDASRKPGMDLKLGLGGKIQFVIDFTFDDLFGKASTLKDVQANLDKAKEVLEETGEFYEHYKNDEDVNNFVKGEDDEWGITIKIGPFTIWDNTLQWYPSVYDESFITTKHFIDDETMGIRAEYKIEKDGLLGAVGDSNGAFCPALRIIRGKASVQKEIDIIFPEEGGRSAKVQKGNTYHFEIPQMEIGKEYRAQICYLENGSSKPVAVDKSLPFTFYSPAVIIESVEPVGLEENPEGWGKEGRLFCYLFKVDSRVKVEGAKALATWGVKDQVSGTTNSKSKNNANKDKDGIWTLHWYLKTCTNTPVTLKKLEKHLDLYPYYRLETNDDNKRGNHYEIMVYSDGTYDILDDGEGFSATGLTYDKSGGANVKRMLPGAGNTSAPAQDNDTDNEYEMWIESIEDPDGNIVYRDPKKQKINYRKL